MVAINTKFTIAIANYLSGINPNFETRISAIELWNCRHVATGNLSFYQLN